MSARRIEVLLFAGIREQVGRDRVEVEVQEPADVARVIEALAGAFPHVAGALAHCRIAVDREIVGPADEVPAGAEVAVIPPVSGGHGGVELAQGRCRLTTMPLVESAVASSAADPGTGAVVTFAGHVRGHSRGRAIRCLEYEAYPPMALAVMAQIAGDIEARVGGARLAIQHRIGHLEVGEVAVVIAAAAPHREEAFAACREAIERLKREVPIWKKEIARDGSEWFARGP